MGDEELDSCDDASGGLVYAKLVIYEWHVFGVTSHGDSPAGEWDKGGDFGLKNKYASWIEKESNADQELPAGHYRIIKLFVKFEQK